MRAFYVISALILVAYTYSLPLQTKTYCNSCLRPSQDQVQIQSLPEARDYGISVNTLSFRLTELNKELNSTVENQMKSLTFPFGRRSNQQDECKEPIDRDTTREFLMCIYNAISVALRNIVENSVYSDMVNTDRIVQKTRTALCEIKLFLLQNSDSYTARTVQTNLSPSACAKSISQRLVTPSSMQFFEFAESLRVAQNIVYKANETLVRYGRFLQRRQISQTKGNTKRRKNKCKKGKRKSKKCKRRNKNRRKYRKRFHKIRNRNKFGKRNKVKLHRRKNISKNNHKKNNVLAKFHFPNKYLIL